MILHNHQTDSDSDKVVSMAYDVFQLDVTMMFSRKNTEVPPQKFAMLHMLLMICNASFNDKDN